MPRAARSARASRWRIRTLRCRAACAAPCASCSRGSPWPRTYPRRPRAGRCHGPRRRRRAPRALSPWRRRRPCLAERARMFKRRRNQVSPPAVVRAGAASASAQRLTVEELEPWILMSADAAVGLTLLSEPLAAEDEVFQLLAASDPVAAAGQVSAGGEAAAFANSTAQPETTSRVELVFIDARVAADESVLADLAAQTARGSRLEVIVVHSRLDGLAQIDAALAGREDIAALHIVSHGDDGRLLLGNGVLDAAALEARAGELSAWRGALTADADILLYGCNTGAGAGGLALVQTLASLTGADVAASDDATGYAARGGDWQLEVRTGPIDTGVVFGTAFQQSWQGTLPITTGTTTDSGTAGATSLTWSHTVASGTDRLLVVSGAASSGTGVTSVTYGCQALTLLDSATSGGGGAAKSQLWYLVAPAQGTANVVVNVNQSASFGASATTFFGVDQTQPFGTTATAIGVGTTISGATVTSAAGELVVDSVVILNRSPLASGAGQTQLFGLGGAGGALASSTEPGAASVTMSWTGSGSGSGTVEWALVAAPIKPSVNTAPVLDVTKSPALTAINENAGAPVGAVGTLVSSLVDFAVPSGQVDNVTDADSGAVLGIAVTAANATNGTWWYATNNGGSWLALGAVSDANARLLAADGATRLYFQPNASYNGTIANAVTFRAWDRTSGSNGATVATTTNGGSSAFSTATDTASLLVNDVNSVAAGTTSSGSTAAGTSLTWSETVAAGADRLLVVTVAVHGDKTNITSVTYGGQALTLLASANRPGGGGDKTEMWYMVAPTVGAANVVITTAQNTSIVGSATTFYDVDQTTPFRASATANGKASHPITVH